MPRLPWLIGSILTLLCTGFIAAGEKVEHFDRDPGWDGQNNRSEQSKPREVKQDFGYSRTAHAGGQAGEIGGFITAAAEPAYYAKRLEPKSFDDVLTASGRLICKGNQFHALLGFFNSGTINEWRTPSSIAIRLHGRGDVFFAYVEYATARWRAGADSPDGFATVRDPMSGRINLRGFPIGKVLRWSLRYDPTAREGKGSIIVTLGDETAVCHLDAGHKADGASFNRFGLLPVLKSADDGGDIWFDDITINGQKEDFSSDPGWEGFQNRRIYKTRNIRPSFDFGYSPTQHAEGQGKGELGGLVFRGDCRYPDKLAAYGDRLSKLTLEKPLSATGKVSLRRAVSDSTVLLGFYHSKESLHVSPSQASGFPNSFLGIAIEGPSSEGFFVYPAYRNKGDGQGYADGPKRPRIMPDGKANDWSLSYDPAGDGGRGSIVVKLGDQSVKLDLGAEHKKTGAAFDRFGLITTWIDGNGQLIYFDDLRYTSEQ
jgi:hypothetical protein